MAGAGPFIAISPIDLAPNGPESSYDPVSIVTISGTSAAV
jgi:hypothetical protein